MGTVTKLLQKLVALSFLVLPFSTTVDANPLLKALIPDCAVMYAQVNQDPGSGIALIDRMQEENDIRGTYASNLQTLREMASKENYDRETFARIAAENGRLLAQLKQAAQELGLKDPVFDEHGLLVRAEPTVSTFGGIIRKADGTSWVKDQVPLKLFAANPNLKLRHPSLSDLPTTLSEFFEATVFHLPSPTTTSSVEVLRKKGRTPRERFTFSYHRNKLRIQFEERDGNQFRLNQNIRNVTIVVRDPMTKRVLGVSKVSQATAIIPVEPFVPPASFEIKIGSE